MRIGLLGGTFDPVHRGHVAVASAAMDALHLHRVYFIPALISPHKTHRSPTSAEHRLAMLRLALQEHPNFFVSAAELDRPGPSYTVDTLREFRELFPDSSHQLFWLIGEDNLASFPSWKNAREILRMAQLAVYPRKSDSVPYENTGRIPHKKIPAPRIDISASEIRRALSLGQDVSSFLHPEVLQYITEHGLYRSE